MAMKKAIVRIEIEYNDTETTPDQVSDEIAELLKEKNRYKAKKAKYREKMAFQDNSLEPQWWTALCIYYPYSKKKCDE